MPKISVAEGDSYSPDDPRWEGMEEQSRKPRVEVRRDLPAPDASQEDRDKLNEGVAEEVQKAKKAYADGDGPRVVDQTSDDEDDDERGAESSPGKTSSPSETSRGPNTTNERPASQSSAPSTGGPSTTAPTGSSTARSAATKSQGPSGKAR